MLQCLLNEAGVYMKSIIVFLAFVISSTAFAEAGNKTYLNTDTTKLVLEIILKSETLGLSDKIVCSYQLGVVEVVLTDLDEPTAEPKKQSVQVGVQRDISIILHDVLWQAKNKNSTI